MVVCLPGMPQWPQVQFPVLQVYSHNTQKELSSRQLHIKLAVSKGL